MTSLDWYKRQATALKKGFAAGEAEAVARVRAVRPDAAQIRHADALHVVAREAGHDSWPRLKFATEAAQMDRAAKQERLKIALYFGQHWVVDALLTEAPDLAQGSFGLACALYDIEQVRAVLGSDPGAATRSIGIRNPMSHLAFSRHIQGGGSESDMLAVAEALLAHGADVNDFYNYNNDPNSPLSVLYGALGHAQNLTLARWLLERGADPNDGESLYHATELGTADGLRMLLEHGARPHKTNALPHALDADNEEMVRLLLEAGADPNEGIDAHPSGEPSWVVPCLHQAARRMSSPAIIDLLLAAGADPSVRHNGLTPYAMARVYGHHAAAQAYAAAGGDTTLTDNEKLLAAAADGPVPEGRFLDAERLPDEYRQLLHNILQLPGKQGHVERLVAIGAEWDRPDAMGVPPVQVAGWHGLPDMVRYFLAQKPDLSHRNAYGGGLLGTIIHGSENCGERADRDHVACARLALEEGVALPRAAIELAGAPDMAAFLAEWAEAHPGQVVETEPG